MEQWYTLHTRLNAEYQVAVTLQKRGLEIYLPTIRSLQTQPDRVGKPFFPCYLFARIDFETTGLSQIQWTPGLRRLVSFDDRPAPLTDEFIKLIQDKLVELEKKLRYPASCFEPGETVRITAGPFQDMLAIFAGPTIPGRRVQVLLTILGQASQVHLDVTELDKAAPGASAPKPRPPRRTRGRGR